MIITIGNGDHSQDSTFKDLDQPHTFVAIASVLLPIPVLSFLPLDTHHE